MVPQQRTNSSDKLAPDLSVVAIGGGTGLSTLLKGLKGYVLTPSLAAAGQLAIRELCGVVTVTDDGGSSGRLRKEFNMLPPGDVRNCIVALSEDEACFRSSFSIAFRGVLGWRATASAIFFSPRSLPLLAILPRPSASPRKSCSHEGASILPPPPTSNSKP